MTTTEQCPLQRAVTIITYYLTVKAARADVVGDFHSGK